MIFCLDIRCTETTLKRKNASISNNDLPVGSKVPYSRNVKVLIPSLKLDMVNVVLGKSDENLICAFFQLHNKLATTIYGKYPK